MQITSKSRKSGALLRGLGFVALAAIPLSFFQNCTQQNLFYQNGTSTTATPGGDEDSNHPFISSMSRLSVNYGVLQTFHAGCTGATATNTPACSAAANRFCGQNGFLTGVDITDSTSNQATVACLSNTGFELLAVSVPQLQQFHSDCQAETRSTSVACRSAVSRFCSHQNYAGGLGIAEVSSDTAYVHCAKGQAMSRESASFHVLTALQSSCTFANANDPSCLSAVNRNCTALGYDGGFGPFEVNDLFANFLCFNSPTRPSETTVETLSYFLPSQGSEHRTGSHQIALFGDASRQTLLFTKFNDPSKWMLYAWDEEYIHFLADNTVPELDPTSGTYTGRDLTSVTSSAPWLKRKMRVGETIYVNANQQLLDSNCRPLRNQNFPYAIRLKSVSPQADLGGDLGLKSIIVIEYTYFENTGASPTFNSEEEVYAADPDPGITSTGVILGSGGLGLVHWTLFDRQRQIALANGIPMSMNFNMRDTSQLSAPNMAGSCAAEILSR